MTDMPGRPPAPIAQVTDGGLRAAITAELIKHHYEIDIYSFSFTPYCRCDMPATRGHVNTDAEWAEHVAVLVVSAILDYQEKHREAPEGKEPDGPS